MNLFDQTTILGLPSWLLIIAIVWSLIWKGLALWKSAKRDSKIWFVILLVVNTVGILEILYIYLFSEIKLDEKTKLNNKAKVKTKRKEIKLPILE